MPKMKTADLRLNVSKLLLPVNSSVPRLLEAISWNTSLRPVRETCVKLPWSIRLTMNA